MPMTDAEAKARHAKLVAEIRAHDHAYYVEAKPSISDREYDELYGALKELERDFPALVSPDSPTQRVGGEPIKGFKPVRHLLPMMSLDNTYSQATLQSITTSLQNLKKLGAV